MDDAATKFTLPPSAVNCSSFDQDTRTSLAGVQLYSLFVVVALAEPSLGKGKPDVKKTHLVVGWSLYVQRTDEHSP